jgi:GABA(A) receptor-associated protein
MTVPRFREKHTLEERLSESNKIGLRHPFKVPVIIEPHRNEPSLLDKFKFLVPQEFTMGQFQAILRRRTKLDQTQALFVFIDGNLLVPMSVLMEVLYMERKDSDGFLYITYSRENTFGELKGKQSLKLFLG